MDRPKRANAGSKMRELIDKQVRDGILVIGEDLDEVESLASESALVDVDFSMLNDEEDIMDDDFESTDEDDLLDQAEFEKKVRNSRFIQEEDDNPKKKPKITLSNFRPQIRKLDKDGGAKEAVPVVKKPRVKRDKLDIEEFSRQSGRSATIESRIDLQKRIELDEENKRYNAPRKRPTKAKMLTQEQLLLKASKIEAENLASIRYYDELEDEKKRKVVKKIRQLQGPTIRFRSFTDTDNFQNNSVEEISSTPLIEENSSKNTHITQSHNHKKVSRNTISFLNFEESPLKRWSLKPESNSLLCPITGMKAHYIDPKTKLPYANLHAYKVIQEIYNHKYIWSPIYGAYIHETDIVVDGAPENWVNSTKGANDEEWLLWEEKYRNMKLEEIAHREEQAQIKKAAQSLKLEEGAKKTLANIEDLPIEKRDDPLFSGTLNTQSPGSDAQATNIPISITTRIGLEKL